MDLEPGTVSVVVIASTDLDGALESECWGPSEPKIGVYASNLLASSPDVVPMVFVELSDSCVMGNCDRIPSTRVVVIETPES